MGIKKSKASLRKPLLVEDTATKLRNMILDRDPGTQIGSLPEVAQLLGVGIVTVQQSARILEHEGLLEVKRGPGGGYYGSRPDDAALERAFATYLRVHNFGYRDAFEMLILIDCDMIPAAAKSEDETFRQSVTQLLARLECCEQPEDRVQFESDLRETLFNIAERPFLVCVSRVTMQLYKLQSKSGLFFDPEMVQIWKAGRLRILQAILKRDEELARFEAERYRQVVVSWLRLASAHNVRQ